MDEKLAPIKSRLSNVIHSCVTEIFELPEEKRANRFFHLSRDNFYMPDGRTDAYTIIEITTIKGRSVAARKNLIRPNYPP